MLRKTAIAFAASVAGSAFAAETEPLPAVVVTARPFSEQDEFTMTQPASVLRGDSLRRTQTTNLGDTLDTQVGVQSSSFAAGSGRPIIRGLDGARVQVLNNGLGVLDVSTVSPDHQVTADPFSAQQIEILRGPSTVLYGGTVGGVVNVVSERIPVRRVNGMSGTGEALGQTVNNEIAGRARVDGGTGPFAFALDGFIRNAGDYSIPGSVVQGDPSFGSGTLPNSFTRSRSGSGGLSYVGERGYVGAAATTLSSNYGLPGPEFSHIDLNDNRYDFAGALDDPVPGFRNGRLKFVYSDYRHNEVEQTDEVATTFKNTAYEGRLETRHNPIGGFDGVLGLQYLDRNFSAIGEESFIQPVNTQGTGVFLLEQYNFNERWRLDAGARVDFVQYRPRDDSTVLARNFSPFSLSAGLLWKFKEGYNAAFNVARAQRAPAIEELYPNGPHAATSTFDVGDAGLQTETANNVDLTVRKIAGDWQWSATAYYTYFQDYIFGSFVAGPGGQPVRVDADGTPDPNGEFLLQQFRQASSAEFRGVEAQVSYRILRPLVLRVFGDYTRATINDFGNAPRIGPGRFGTDATFQQGPWSAYLLVLGAFRQDQTAPLETPTPGYVRVDAEVSYTLTAVLLGKLTVFLQGRNLLDQDIRAASSYTKAFAPLPGRSALLGVRGQF